MQLGNPPGHDDDGRRGRATSIERPLSVLLDEVRSSIDYYRNQPGSSPLLRIVATGGAAQLPGSHRATVGARRRSGRAARTCTSWSRIGDIGFSDEELPRLEPYLPAAVGLALGGAGVGTVIDLLPRTRRSSTTSRKVQISPKVVRGRRGAGGRDRRSDVHDAAEPLEREGEARCGRGADRPGDERVERAPADSASGRHRSRGCSRVPNRCSAPTWHGRRWSSGSRRTCRRG